MSQRAVAFVTDSTAYLPKDLVEQYAITVVPNVVNWGTKAYRDGVDISSSEFFERLKTDPVQPTTAVASIGEFRDHYAKAAEAAPHVIGIHLSHKLSGTFSAAEQARAMLPDKDITVIDSNATAMALGFVLLAAARAAEAGQPLAEVVAAAKAAIPRVGLVFTVETLEYLRRGGRIGGAQAFLGGLLDMKPILELRDGRVEPVERVRSKKKALDRVLDIIAEQTAGRGKVHLATIHAAAAAEAAGVLAAAKERLNAVEGVMAEASPTVATHTGPGTVGLAYYVEG
ncbi:MAG: DegV family protein [Anaerolineales bacterium]|nr:DegV family protein [Anaerolineales bacterium]